MRVAVPDGRSMNVTIGAKTSDAVVFCRMSAALDRLENAAPAWPG